MAKSATSIAGVILIVFLVILAMLPFLFADPARAGPVPDSFRKDLPDPPPQGMGGEFPLGTGENAAGTYYGIIWGARISMAFAIQVVHRRPDGDDHRPCFRVQGRGDRRDHHENHRHLPVHTVPDSCHGNRGGPGKRPWGHQARAPGRLVVWIHQAGKRARSYPSGRTPTSMLRERPALES